MVPSFVRVGRDGSDWGSSQKPVYIVEIGEFGTASMYDVLHFFTPCCCGMSSSKTLGNL